MILRKAGVGHSPPRKARALSLSCRCSSLSPKSIMYFHSLYHLPLFIIGSPCIGTCHRHTADARLRASGEGPLLVLAIGSVAHRTIAPHYVPHPEPVCQWHVPTTGEGIKKKGKGNEKP